MKTAVEGPALGNVNFEEILDNIRRFKQYCILVLLGLEGVVLLGLEGVVLLGLEGVVLLGLYMLELEGKGMGDRGVISVRGI